MEYTEITLDLIDVTAKADSTPVASDIQPFADTVQLKRDDLTVPDYATLEENFFLLDGSKPLFPDSPAGMNFGYWSQSMSGAGGYFENPPTLKISFTEQHTSAGLTLHFLPDFPAVLNIQWLALDGILMISKDFQPDALDYFCECPVENFGKLIITFKCTAKPYRYIKLHAIDYGTFLTYSDTDVVSAKITEEVDLISNTLSINMANFTLHSPTDDFNLMNPQGVFKLFQQGQKVHIRHFLDTGPVQMGTYRLATWQSADASTGQFTANASVGELDKTDFKLGRVYVNEPAGNIIDAIMDSAGWTDYIVEDIIRNTPLSGWLPIAKHRTALQQVAFAAGAIVDDSRGSTIRIYSQPSTYNNLIPRSRKFSGGNVKLLSYISDVSLTAHNYVLKSDAEQIFQGTLATGQHEIQFDAACAELAITGGTIVEQHANYVVVSVDADGEITITGKKYEDHPIICLRATEKLPAGAARNTIKFEAATLISGTNAPMIAQRLYDYYQLRYQTTAPIILERERAGEKVALQHTDGNGYTMDTIEMMDIDLTGGFVASATFIGNGLDIVMAYHTGELYTGQNMGVL
ncbi:MAG: hypothetical protein E7L17_10930 [Clostridium sp.]|uniref:hypothetical protein n=1 Tax=Clostridium sp. TaxID=1506 RepID=UPI00290D4A5E|nr:hypothetical protein [Clostridium sp.]MDU7338614.1 hypothetical protein [Clostridium sp.]